jgi:hypothetical protein
MKTQEKSYKKNCSTNEHATFFAPLATSREEIFEELQQIADVADKKVHDATIECILDMLPQANSGTLWMIASGLMARVLQFRTIHPADAGRQSISLGGAGALYLITAKAALGGRKWHRRFVRTAPIAWV